MKKISAILLALIMMLSMVASAATITVNGVDGVTYSAYKVFDIEDSVDGTTRYIYTIDANSPWYTAVNTFITAYEGASLVLREGTTYELQGTVAQAHVDDFVAALQTAFDGMTVAADKSAEAENGVATLDGLDDGYYFVTSDLLDSNSTVILNTANDTVTVTEKNYLSTLTKFIIDGNAVKENTASVGETVTYEVTVTIKDAKPVNYVIHDTISAGLTDLAVSSVKLNDTAMEEGTYEIVETPEDGHTIDITFEDDALAMNDVIVVTYTAVLDTDAVVAGNGNTNTAFLTYGTDSETTPEVVTTYTYEFDLVKTDGDNKLLDGAEFVLYADEECENAIAVVTAANGYQIAWSTEATENNTTIAVANGKVVVSGLADGTYYLKETKAPAGYNMVTEPEEIIIAGENLVSTVAESVWTEGGVQVINLTGSELPSTGGIGTTIFYTVGGLMMAAAIVLLVAKKKVAASK